MKDLALKPLLVQVKAILTEAIDLAKRVRPSEATKKAHQDYVTDVDMAVDAFLESRLSALIPTCPVLSEERAVVHNGPLDRYWIVDPIDGTMNLLAGLPFVGICVALANAHGPQLAAVASISDGAIFSAIKGDGAFCDGKRLQLLAPPSDLIVLSTGLLDQLMNGHADAYGALRRLGKIRNLGAQALHLCGVASGQFAAAASLEARLWDEAAGGLILREAGGHWQAASDKADWSQPQAMMAIRQQRSIAAHPAVFEDFRIALSPLFERPKG
jgi:myo-inositol-1(or 4)-monophosphatase